MQRPYDITTEQVKAALRYARREILSGREEFICNALPDDKVGDYLRKFISTNLTNCPGTTLNSWVFSNVYDRQYGKYPNSYQMCLYRLRWIDYMLDQ